MFDAVTLAAVAAELNQTILHGRVQAIFQLDAHAFGLEIYAHHARHSLYLSAHPTQARVHLVTQKLRGSGLTPTPLLLLLRKYAENAFIRAITPCAHERILHIQFDHARAGISTLVIETIGKYSNIILLDADSVVLDALKRVDATINRARVTLPRRAYAPPPPQAKIHPANLDPADLARILAANPRTLLRQTLVSSIASVSPLLAREIAFRITGDCDALNDPRRAAEIVATFHALTRAPWQPCVAFEDAEPAACAPYPLTHLPHQSFDSISRAIETFYGTPESYAAVKEPLRAQLADARNRLARKRDALADALPRAEDVERLRLSGEMILAHAHEIVRGQEILTAEIGARRLEIPLNPNLSVVENAQKFFKEYHRQKDARARVPTLLADANAQVEYVEQMLNDLELAENRAELDAVIADAHAAGLLPTKRRAPRAPSAPRQFTSRDGFTILVGRHARQNDELTFRRARADDVWLHARNVAGAHVLIIRAGGEIPQTTIEDAARLAARYSAARAETNVDVIVAPRKNVRRRRGALPGFVTVRDERIVRVDLTRTD